MALMVPVIILTGFSLFKMYPIQINNPIKITGSVRKSLTKNLKNPLIVFPPQMLVFQTFHIVSLHHLYVEFFPLYPDHLRFQRLWLT